MTAAAQRALVLKEVRAVLPMWAVCAAGVVLASVSARAIGSESAWLVGLAAALLAAQAVGHEFSGRTMDGLLALPVTRQQVWTTKVAVLGVAAAGLVMALVLALTFLRPDGQVSVGGGNLALASAAGLFVAFVFTLLARSALAGLVFTGALAVFAGIAARLGSDWVLPGTPLEARIAFMSTAMLYAVGAAGAVAAVGGWLHFRRFDVRELSGAISWPWQRAGAAAAPRAMGPMRALVAKELRLQSMTFLVAGFGLVVGLIAWRAELSGPGLRGLWVFPVFTIAIASVAGVAGAIACAGERQLGVLPSQHLLPVRSGREWSVKVATTFGVVGALCAVLLVAFVSFDGRDAFVREVTQRVGQLRVPDAEGVFLAVAATTVALWVSSWASNAVSAVALTLVAAPVVAGIAETTLRTAQRIALEVVPRLSQAEYVAIVDDRARLASWMPSMATLAEALIAATFIGLTLTFASRNFRAAERDPGRLALQAVVVAAIAGAMELVRSALHIRGYL